MGIISKLISFAPLEGSLTIFNHHSNVPRTYQHRRSGNFIMYQRSLYSDIEDHRKLSHFLHSSYGYDIDTDLPKTLNR